MTSANKTWIVTQTEEFRVQAPTAEAALEAVLEDPAGETPDVEWLDWVERVAVEV